MYKSFPMEIAAMNNTYHLPQMEPTAEAVFKRATNFKKILGDEVSEIDDIINDAAELIVAGNMTTADHIRLLTGMTDLLGDIIVFCASEAARYNLPLEGALKIIMASNFSKLDAEGKPIIDENGKFQKGPNYWKPEPAIAKLITVTTLGYNQEPNSDRVVALNMDAVADAASRTLRVVVNEAGNLELDATAVPGVNWKEDGSPTDANPMMQEQVNLTPVVVVPNHPADSGSH